VYGIGRIGNTSNDMAEYDRYPNGAFPTLQDIFSERRRSGNALRLTDSNLENMVTRRSGSN